MAKNQKFKLDENADFGPDGGWKVKSVPDDVQELINAAATFLACFRGRDLSFSTRQAKTRLERAIQWCGGSDTDEIERWVDNDPQDDST